MKKGKFFVFEGGEGCGKSIQVEMLAKYLIGKDYDVFTTREPGGTMVGQLIRQMILLNPEIEKNQITELLLFEAARSEFAEKEVKANIEKGKIVISDRYHYSTTAYQGYGRGLDLKMIEDFNKIACQNIQPDLTFIIDIAAEEGLERVTLKEFGKKDWMEKESLDFHKRVNQGYRELAKKDPERIKLIPYMDGNPRKMHKIMVKYVNDLLGIKA